MNQTSVIARLAQTYSQLYLNPDTASQEEFREVLLKGITPPASDLSWYRTDPRDKDLTLPTPAGDIRVITLYQRSDFEYLIRSMMAVKEGPLQKVPESQGAATLITFNWPRIHAHKEEFMKEQRAKGVIFPDWNSEWKRFSSVKANYMDNLVILSIGPYSAVSADQIGCDADEWIELSDTIRKYHELTHVICRTLYPDQIDAIWDEIVADAVGIYAAFGKYDPALAKKFLGITEQTYTGGRLENYTGDPVTCTAYACKVIPQIEETITQHHGAAPFDLIPFIQELHKNNPAGQL